MKPRIFYDNRLADATPIASTTATGDYYANNLTDFRPYTWWKPTALPATVTVDCGSARSADSCFVYGHDLYTQSATFEVRGSTDNFSSSNVLVSTVTPTSNDAFVLTFASVSYRYWRVRLTGTTMPSLAIVAIGARFEPSGTVNLDFDPLGRTLLGQSNLNDNGQPLGKVIDYAEWKGRITWRRMTWAQLRSTFMPAYNAHLRAKPFGWQWHAGVDAVPYLATSDNDLTTTHYSEFTCDVSLGMRAVMGTTF